MDVIGSLVGLIVFSPIILGFAIAVWLQDFKSPFYVPLRVGKNGKLFRMVKLRSMGVNADRSGVDSTANNDARITRVGRLIRAYKLDEVTQLINVFTGGMSLVGPRPNVQRETDLYTAQERRLLSVRPGITDFSSIVFSDEGDILKNFSDPDLAYNQVIRPWKSRLGLVYIEKRSVWLDIELIILTCISLVSKRTALARIQVILKRLGVEPNIVDVASRSEAIPAAPPPGATRIVENRCGRRYRCRRVNALAFLRWHQKLVNRLRKGQSGVVHFENGDLVG